MALLDILHRLRAELDLELIAAGVNHGLRQEAKYELRLVQSEAAKRSIEFVELEVEVERRASLQGAARQARYEALLALKRERRAQKIAVGHHQDDQAETVLHRILRGGGFHGLGGIEPARDDGVIRPLIDTPRADLQAHLERFRIPFVLDPTNREHAHERVRIREVLLPMLEEEDPQIRVHLAQIADEARAHRERERVAVDFALARIPRGKTIAIQALELFPTHIRPALLTAFIERELPLRLNRPHRESTAALLRAKGEVLLPGGYQVIRSGQRILLRAPERSGIEDA